MKEPCKISVIIPAYNAEEYILNCCRSIKEQTFLDYEIIFIDDCSKDSTTDCIQTFINENPHLSCILLKNCENRGDTYSRNIGFRMASGKYICTIDADDTCHPKYLELLYNTAETTNSEIVFCGYDRCWKDKIISYSSTWKYPSYLSVCRLKYDFFTTKTHICHCTILYNRHFFMGHNLQYFEGCRHAGDTALVTKVLFHVHTFACVPQSLYYYNIHPNSISTKVPTSEKFDGYYAYERVLKSIKNPFWKTLFFFTREAREVFHIIESFYSKNMELPYLFCSKYKIMLLLFINSLRKYKKDAASFKIMKLFFNNYFRKV